MPGRPSAGKSVASHAVTTTVPRKHDGLPHHPAQAPKHTWAEPGSATVTLPAASGKAVAVRAGDLPVSLAVSPRKSTVSAKAVSGAEASKAAPLAGAAQVRVLDQKAARAAGVDGLLFTVTSQPGSGGSTVGVRVDDSGYAQAYGGAYTARLHLVKLPECALTTPTKPSCTRQTPLRTANDPVSHTLSADQVALSSASPTSSSEAVSYSSGIVKSSAVVLAATTGASSDQGDYSATSLSPSSTFNVGLNTGDFSWSYDMPVPTVPGSFAPSVGLSYDSSGVDGRTSNTNNQASWVGDGFNLWPGSIERSYKPCADEGVKDASGYKVGDLCWAYDNATISFNGHSGQLVATGTNSFRIKGDDGTKVDRIYGSTSDVRSNGAHNDEYWRVTTTDGTRYYFGYNRLPGWASGNTATNSTWTAPVYGNNSGEPCNASTYAASWCQQGWRWNLDYAVDTHGNAIAYYYTKESGYYGRDNTASSPTAYDRGGSLDHIEYGLKSTAVYSAKALARVDFASSERCLETTSGTCDAAKIDTNSFYWYDTPWDLNCKSSGNCSNFAPSFWTRTRLSSVTTQVLKSDGTYTPVDSWDLAQQWGMADIDYQLELASIQHTGKADTPEGAPDITLPKVTFGYDQRANRLDIPGDNTSPFIKERLATVDDESGGQIDVTYSTAACDASDLPTPDSNTTLCFPQYFTKQGDENPSLQWFNKYVVDQVIQTDRTKTAPDMVTRYDYLGGTAWHFDSDDGLTKEKYKTWSTFRGFGHVRVETGGQDPVGMLSQTDHYFLRGMDGDKTSGGTRSVSVSDDNGGTITDHDSLSGVEYKTEDYSGPGGKVLDKTVSTPWHHQTASVTRSWGTIAANLTGTAETRTWTSLDNGAGANWRSTDATNTFENTAGRVVTTDDQGDVSTSSDDQCTRTTYVDNTSAWILEASARVLTLSVACSATPNYSKDVISDVLTAYDGQAYGAAPTLGDATHFATLNSNDGTTITYLESGKAYDAYGRVVSSTDLTGNVTATETGTPQRTDRNDGHTTTMVFTPTTGFPTTVAVTTPPATPGISATAQTTTATLDAVRGVPLTVVDTNSKRTDTVYDALGRNAKIWLADRSKAGSQTPNYSFSYTITDGKPTAVGTTTLAGTGTQTSYTFYDGFLRARQTQTPGPQGGMLVADTFYDARGLVERAFAPYYTAKAPSTVLSSPDTPSAVQTQTWNDYDGLGRITQTQQVAGNSDGGQVLSTTTTAYGGDRTTVTPPQGATPTTTIVDARGNTRELDQYHASTPTGAYDKTLYDDTPSGKLAKLTDPAGNIWSYTYDQRGNPHQAVDPDNGTTTSVFDDRNQLVSTTDQRGKSVTHLYDGLGRETETHDGDATGPLLTKHVWDPTGFKGQLSSATRYVGGATGSAYTLAYQLYDNLYRPHRTTTTIPAAEGSLAGSYQSNVQYNADGTIQSLGYPAAGSLAAEAVLPTYDDVLRPVTLSGSGGATYITGTTYSNIGQPLQYTYQAAGQKMTQVTNTYQWGTQRLSNSRVDRQDVPGTDKSATYGYDQAGNITSVTDVTRDGTDAQCFSYDFVGRLTEAWAQGSAGCAATPSASVLGGPAPYWQSFGYDTVGDRKSETDHSLTGDPAQDTVQNYSYPPAGGPHPHALSQVDSTGPSGSSTDSYTYDDDGNTQTRTLAGSKQTLIWDSEGHLAQVSADDGHGGTATTSYVYDADGIRLITRTDSSTTLFLGNTEITLATGSTTPHATRYYDLGDGNQAIRTDDNKLSFLIGDHQGTSQLAINSTDLTMQQRRTTPFGALRGSTPSSWPGDKGFVGGTSDPSTGLTHLGARDYDPDTGRFLSVDPVLDPTKPQLLNGYAYSNNSPVTSSDPTGLYGSYCVTVECVNETGGPGTAPTSDPDQIKKDSKHPKGHLNGCGANYTTESCNASRNGSSPSSKPPTTAAQKFLEKIPPDRLQKFRAYLHMVIRESPTTWNVPGSSAYNAIMVRLRWAINGPLTWEDIWKGTKGTLAGLAVGLIGAALCPESAGAGCVAAVGAMSGFVSQCVDDCSNKTALALSSLAGAIAGYAGGKLGMPCSFAPDTPVLLANGKTKPIKKIKLGDQVESADPSNGSDKGGREVEHVWINHDTDLLDITVTAGQGDTAVLHTTANHPFWDDTTHTWVRADHLKAGHQLASTSGRHPSVVGTKATPGTADRWNLTVEQLHTYYVVAGGTPILVHNSGGGMCGIGNVEDGNILYHVVDSPQGPIEMMANVSIADKEVVLSDIAVYGQGGMSRGSLGREGTALMLREIRRVFLPALSEQGYGGYKLRIAGVRVSGPVGHRPDMTFPIPTGE
ncbi:polymorphic toxin-type HINT domain-containing protein [Peterkaempfera sp. SMS 1(5)a]|uniref:polymorphic toxin-type HINT domain-containing protein n=1 Tax=Peterkaempfera podocarpi TaxID=3232308 RepID=UPI0036732DE1